MEDFLQQVKREMDAGDESVLNFVKSLGPKPGEAEQLAVLLQLARERYPVGTPVKVLWTQYTGVVYGHNERLGGFYPGVRYPIYVRITATGNPKFEEAVGKVYEYGMDQMEVIQNG
jgi:hypothetical protein